jgi:hypothetical protein
VSIWFALYAGWVLGMGTCVLLAAVLEAHDRRRGKRKDRR